MITGTPSISLAAGVFGCYLLSRIISQRTDAFLPSAVLIWLYGEPAIPFAVGLTILFVGLAERFDTFVGRRQL